MILNSITSFMLRDKYMIRIPVSPPIIVLVNTPRANNPWRICIYGKPRFAWHRVDPLIAVNFDGRILQEL